MRKIPTLFKKNPSNLGLVIPEFDEGLPSLNKLVAHPKWDGQACMVVEGMLYTRYDNKPRYKRGKLKAAKPLPAGSIECQEPDPITGHHPFWVPVMEDNSQYKWVWQAFLNSGGQSLGEGTYEAVGPHHQSNPHGYDKDVLVPHALTIGDIGYSLDVSDKSAEEVYKYFHSLFTSFPYEGLVFYYHGLPVAKLRRSDFGLPSIKYNKAA